MTHYSGSVPETPGKPDWRLQGACRDHDDPDIWHATGNTRASRIEQAAATAICGGCPVKAMCRQWSIATRQAYGTWGGMTEGERRQLLRIRVTEGEDEPRRGGRPRAACGTPSAYDRHIKLGEPIDDACRMAHTRVSAERRQRAKQRTTKQLAA